MPRTRPITTVTLLVALAGCTESARSTTPRSEPVAAVPTSVVAAPVASSAPSAAALDGGPPRFVAWTEPAAIDALVLGAVPSKDTDDPRSCEFELPEQSCIPGPDSVAWGCRTECSDDCDWCGTSCLTAMATCRTPCPAGDAACARRCGQSAGACLSDCMSARDRCATGVCAKRVADYETQLRTNYGCKDKRTALAICQRTVSCIEGCSGAKASSDQQTACRERCKSSRASGCDQDFLDAVEMSSCGQFDLSP